jgi:predicted nucleic acid-binding protein
VKVLLDVNLLLAAAWQSHGRHRAVLAWLATVDTVKICTVVELGFLRVSMSPGFRVPFTEALRVLGDTKLRGSMTGVPGDLEARSLPLLKTHSEVTDAYLVQVARAHQLRVATLDDILCEKEWAAGIAFNPLRGSSLV